jgi:hypothetical protein
MPNLSRRHLVTTVAALPALAMPAAARASACTLPPDLIERFLRMHAWYLADNARWSLQQREYDKRFEAATGVPRDQYIDMSYDDPRRKELEPVERKISNEIHHESGRTGESEDFEETEAGRLCDERWAVAEAMMAHEPRSIVDVAWQLEAWLIADLELFNSEGDDCTSTQLFRMFVEHVRALGAVPQPEDPFGALSLADSEAVQS